MWISSNHAYRRVNHSGGWLISLIFDGQTARVFLWARSSVEMLTPDRFAAAW